MPNTEWRSRSVCDEPSYLVTGSDLRAMATSARSGVGRFGFTDTQFSYIPREFSQSNPYKVLGVTPDIGNDAAEGSLSEARHR
jgi:hypothetical protein